MFLLGEIDNNKFKRIDYESEKKVESEKVFASDQNRYRPYFGLEVFVGLGVLGGGVLGDGVPPD